MGVVQCVILIRLETSRNGIADNKAPSGNVFIKVKWLERVAKVHNKLTTNLLEPAEGCTSGPALASFTPWITV